MASIFPEGSTAAISYITTDGGSLSYGKSPIFDFTTGEFKKIDGKVYMAEDVEVLKNWIEKTLRTERYRFPIYSFNYGVTLEELCSRNLPFELLSSELRNQITDALILDPRIKQVTGFKFSKSGSSLDISFKVVAFNSETVNMEVSV